MKHPDKHFGGLLWSYHQGAYRCYYSDGGAITFALHIRETAKRTWSYGYDGKHIGTVKTSVAFAKGDYPMRSAAKCAIRVVRDLLLDSLTVFQNAHIHLRDRDRLESDKAFRG